MAQQYEATQGEERRSTPPPFLAPVAQNGSAGHDGLGTVEALPIRSAIVRIDNPNYPGYAARMRLNPRRSVVRELASGEIGPASKAISTMVVAWNFKNERGELIEPTPEEVEDLPDDLLSALITGYYATFAEATAPKEE